MYIPFSGKLPPQPPDHTLLLWLANGSIQALDAHRELASETLLNKTAQLQRPFDVISSIVRTVVPTSL